MNNSDGIISSKLLQNWDNFCRYHAIGDWHGTWSIYSSKAEIIDSFKCIRSFHLSIDGSQINHQNHYTYSDGKTKTETFGPYKKPLTRALYLDNSFSWGSTMIAANTSFWFETGFSHQERRAGVVVVYDDRGVLQQIITIPEHLASFVHPSSSLPVTGISGNWQGSLKSITPELTTSPPTVTAWKSLEDLHPDYLTLQFPDGISISCPGQLEQGKELFFAVDWLVPSGLFYYRGIRYFESSEFTVFTLQTFTEALT